MPSGSMMLAFWRDPFRSLTRSRRRVVVRFVQLTLVTCLISFTKVESSQCCSLDSALLVQRKWQEAMILMDTDDKIALVEDIINALKKRTPAVHDVITGRLARDPVYRKAEKKHAYLKVIRELGVMVALITNPEGLERHAKHFVLTNHVHYGPEVEALVDTIEAVFWGVYQISYLNPAFWYSCVFEIIHMIQYNAALAITERLYARCDIYPNSGDQSEAIEGTIMFEQPIIGGSTVIRGSLSGFDTTDSDVIHGFYIHEIGSVGNRCMDAGSHYNPEKAAHGAPYDEIRHIGDLGNIVEDADGVAEVYMWDPKVSLFGDHSVLNRTLVIHQSIDSFSKSSTYGERLACCVITQVQTPQLF